MDGNPQTHHSIREEKSGLPVAGEKLYKSVPSKNKKILSKM